ncbi:hypothetical protein PHMEG_00024700 [Phytophthora megakarya]|uniref:Uncharacterized protein n=1 Tax=Phytophthora megakarya TaxID=4795 RepID=A0A225VF37_9STRA|nr:hypothetical protein PHMEG_00024700 [Phytophthora megakarya]
MTTPATAAIATIVAPTARCAGPGLTPVQEEVQEVIAQEVAYTGSLRDILRWIVDTKKVEPPKYFDGDGQIDLECFTAADFEAFLCERRKTIGVISLNGFRSATKALYRRQEIALPVVYEKHVNVFLGVTEKAGYEKSIQRSTRIWKRPHAVLALSKALLCFLSRQVGGLVHLFLTTLWNLMCRSESVQTLSSEHLSVHDGSLGCTMHKSKANQE